MALGRKGSRRSFRPTLDGTLEPRNLMATLTGVHVQTAAGGQAVVITDPDGGQYFVSVFNGGSVKASAASGGRVNLVVRGTTSQSLLEINQVQPFIPTGKGLAHTFNPVNSTFAQPLNVASINVVSGRIGSIEGYHDAILSGPITVSGTIAVNRIAFGTIAPGGSISVGGDLQTLEVYGDADFSASSGLFVGRDLNWFNVGGNLTFENGANAVVARDLGHVAQPAKGSGQAGQGLFVGGNFTITAPSAFVVTRYIPYPAAGVLVTGNFVGISNASANGFPFIDYVGTSTFQNINVQGTIS